ncbi:MAG: hypothetical protein L6R48_25780, partial [Planctomycetes bacterium]|nr:hypothetical protein [Planctomycetota bacterium]
GGQVLRVAAPAAGAVGASAAALPVAPGDPTRRFRVQVRAAPGSAGVRPWAFLGCWAGNRFLGRVDFKTPLATGASWALISGGVRPDQLPAGTERIQLNLAAQADGKIAAAGALEFDDLRISEDPAEFRLDGATPGNWLAAGEALVLRPAGGRLPAAVAALETVARDSDGREVARFATPRAQVEAEGLRWTPPAAGLYELALTCVLADGTRTPQVERWPARKPDGSLAECERAAIACAVAAAPTRTAAARWGVLGVSYGGDDGDDILELADRLGVAFVRYHWIPWGWAWNPAAIVEPEPGRYQWQHLDGRFAAIRDRGLGIIGNVISTPRWASPHPEQEEIAICIKKWSTYAPTDLTRWTGFLDTLVKRYPFVRTWELWNEPHLPGGSVFWHDSPEAFARLLASGYLAVKAADPQTTVWIGGLGGRRYLPFYKELLRLGGGAPYDVLALHGTWCDPAPFRALDRTAGLRERAWVNSEYHATLVRHDPQGIPDERAIARRMYLDLLSQVALGAERIALFETANHTEREALPHAQDGIVDGLYRRRPRLEPRLAAVVVQRLSTLFGSQVVPGAQAVLGDQRAALFRSDGRPLLLYWSDAATASAPAPQLAAALAGARLSDWEGRPLP